MSDNIIQDKSYKFSLRIIKLYKYLIAKDKDYSLFGQILRSGTSIGANVEEAIGAQSKKDFKAKMFIAYKEARETRYWLNLLKDSGYIDKDPAESILIDAEEICRIIGKIISTSKNHDN
jgi:four helix bundle protein